MIEHNVISTALQKPELTTGSELRPEYFTDTTLSNVWSTIQCKMSQGELINFVLIANEMKNQTGQDYVKLLGEICRNALPATNSETFNNYVSVLAENHRERAALAACEGLKENIGKGGALAIDACIRDLMALSAENKKYAHTTKEILRSAVEEIQQAWECKGLVGLPTGLNVLDEQLGGFHKSDLIILGARPSLGKTALMINFMVNGGNKVGCISSEQSAAQLGMRCISLQSTVSLHDMRLAKYKEEENSFITQAVSTLSDRQIYVNDRPGINILEIQRQAREWVQKYGIQILFVDYLQKINPSMNHNTKADAVGEVAIGLKNLAKELNIPVVALAQVNRSVESRTDKRPMSSDLKDCGIIEQEADVIAMLYRDEVYNDNTDQKGIAEINIEKNRSGPIGDLKCMFDKKTLRFTDIQEYLKAVDY